MAWQRKAVAVGAVAWTSGMVLAQPAFGRSDLEPGMEWRDRMTAVGSNGACGGSSGGAVVYAVQSNLWAAGNLASAQIDGQYGPVTEAAMKSFQAAHGMSQTGCLDYGNWNSFQNATAPNGAYLFALAQDSTQWSNWKFSGSAGAAKWQWDRNCRWWSMTIPSTGYKVQVGNKDGGINC